MDVLPLVFILSRCLIHGVLRGLVPSPRSHDRKHKECAFVGAESVIPEDRAKGFARREAA